MAKKNDRYYIAVAKENRALVTRACKATRLKPGSLVIQLILEFLRKDKS